MFGKKRKKNKNGFKKEFGSILPRRTKEYIWGILLIVFAILISMSFFGRAGMAGENFMRVSNFLIGQAIFLIPLTFMLGGLIFLNPKFGLDFDDRRRVFWPVVLAILLFVSGITGILGTLNTHKKGGIIGYLFSWPVLKYFGFWASQIIFLAPIVIGALIFLQFFQPARKKIGEDGQEKEEIKEPSIIRKIFYPKFKVKEVASNPTQEAKPSEKQAMPLKLETKSIEGAKVSAYRPPPLDLLERQHGEPNSGDTKVNAAIIKKTFQNFGIDVSMSEINIGPTVTQYTFKPAEGIKLSKITGLSNDLALALASHPIRIEAPIPGRSLVGVEMPNKVRAQVRLRDLLEDPNFQKSPANLLVALGRDVSGTPVFTDLTRMPHMLVAGSTGSGKTIFLHTLILSLLYQPSSAIKSAGPEFLRFVLIDPKRVEFPVFENLPHLLCPVIYNAGQTINALRWLTLEMERRFEVLAEAKSRDIGSFNELAYKEKTDPLPFIVVVIDELADLMASKGREIEASIVRLAQMARAVGIHLVVATQRPSVEVITGLIKANINSRVTFQVASQVDSRTIIDGSGAEKLLGRGDMLYISTEITKPKRIQASFISDKEIKKVVAYIILQKEQLGENIAMSSDLVRELDRATNDDAEAPSAIYYGEEDTLYDSARTIVLEAKKASASLLQRRLRIGYARAARLIDILEERGVVGHSDGAKPREVFATTESSEDMAGIPVPKEQEEEEDGEKWEKV